MANLWDKADIGSKIFLGLAGFALSLTLAISQCSQQRQQHHDASQRDREATAAAQRRDLEVAADARRRQFETAFSYVRQAKRGDDVRAEIDLASSFAQTLSAPPYKEPVYQAALTAVRARIEPSEPIKTGSAATSGAEFQAGEARQPPTQDIGENGWFAVIGSFDGNDAGLAQARALARRSAQGGCIEVWRTAISNNYAVVFGGLTTRATALVLAQQARGDPSTADAFAQADRGWKPVDRCAKR